MNLDPRILYRLVEQRDSMLKKGELYSESQLASYYATFRQRFGPDAIRNLDGEALLNTLHRNGERGSLVYWLEFKNDDEFPEIFGGIAGGTALKFGLYWRAERQCWMAGSPQNQRELSVDEAIAIARQHRDQLVRGAELIENLPRDGSDSDYHRLQEQLDEVAHDVFDSAWGHKYFHMLFPEKLDDYHNPHWQRYHLIKILQRPPDGNGRYVCGGRYVALSRALDVPVNSFSAILNQLDGNPHRYWRVLARYEHPHRDGWPSMRDGSDVAIGWKKLPDLTTVNPNGLVRDIATKNAIKSAIQQAYPGPPPASSQVKEVFDFATGIARGDVVVAAFGAQILGIGRVTGDYSYNPSDPEFPHRRPGEWLNTEEWSIQSKESTRRLTVELLEQADTLIEIEMHLLEPDTDGLVTAPTIQPVIRLEGIPRRIQEILERKGQVILYGPPGTSKTHWAESAARDLAALARHGRLFRNLTESEQKSILSGGGAVPSAVRMCTFHPGYGYEDFIEGYRPESNDGGQLAFVRRAGIFTQICQDAANDPPHPYYLIIDEINRGDIPRIFGELLTILEKGRRGHEVLLPLSGTRFQVPPNVYVIGTMNTADRSIALLDAALRRRFGFIELMPDSSVLAGAVIGEIPLGKWLDALNERIRANLGQDARNLQVGHAYFLQRGQPVREMSHLATIVRDDLVPLLEEYCYEDYRILERLLGNHLVDLNRQRIRAELFHEERSEDLAKALLAPCPELAATAEATSKAGEENEVEVEAVPDDVVVMPN